MLRQAELPTGLPLVEIARYQRIFALQDKGEWDAADREIARLSDRLLLGHVLAARYLAATYKSSYAELAAWLALYADLPDAKIIYAMALNRRPPHSPAPPRPIAASSADAMPDVWSDPAQADLANPDAGLAPRAALVARQIRNLAPSAPRRAEALLAGPESRRQLDARTRALLRALIAESYLAAGDAQHALDLSAVPQDDQIAPVAHWDAGLAAWRLGRLGEAREHFEALAQGAGISRGMKSGGAFWAARVALRSRRPEQVAQWLGIAAEEPRTFYGLIARRLLGVDPELDFAAEPFTALDVQVVASMEAGKRALALVAVGQKPRAAAELRTLAGSNRPALLQSLTGLADRAGMPALSLSLAGALAESDGRRHDRALYPIPTWTPQDGFTVDRALLFALMRQESLFLPRALSSAGAEGLMQLMPATARDLAARRGVTLSQRGRPAEERRTLADPEFNLTLAQDYVRMLLADERIKGNLMLFALAYNRGPNALQRWQDLAEQCRNDPLLFLESVPSPESRTFTEHVLANYWIYRQRLGQPTTDLDALAAGRWPTYIAQDRRPDQDGRYAANR